MRDRGGHGRSGPEQEGGQTRAGKRVMGDTGVLGELKTRAALATGQKKRDNKEQKHGLGRPPVPMPAQASAAADQCLRNQKPVWLTRGCPESLLNYDENFPKCPV